MISSPTPLEEGGVRKHKGCLVMLLIVLIPLTGAVALTVHPEWMQTVQPAAAAAVPAVSATLAPTTKRCTGTPTPLPVQCPPTISAKSINTILCEAKSPTCGEGQFVHDLGLQYHIDPVFVLAIFWHESNFGKTGVARFTKSPSNTRLLDDSYQGLDGNFDGYQAFDSWDDGFRALFRELKLRYLAYGLITVETIIPVWAPDADHNDTQEYIQVIRQAIGLWRSGSVRIP